MNIVHYNLTTTTKHGGVETLVWEVTRQQAARGHNVTLIGGAGSVREAIAGVRVLQAPFIDRMRFRGLPGFGRHYAITKLLERASMVPAALPLLPRGGGIAHLHKAYDLLLAPWLRRMGYGVVLHHQGEDFFPGARLLVRYADAHLSCSDWNSQAVERRLGVRPEVVYNGVDVEHFAPGPADEALRSSLAGPGEQLLICVARLIPWKGLQDVLDALALLPAKVRLVVIGAGPFGAELKAQAAALGLTKRVTWLGDVPNRELPRYYRAADLLLAASFASETFGIVLCEAMSCGCPVVATRFGGFPEVLAEGETGLLVPPRDPAAMAGAIAGLLGDDSRRAEMSRAGRRRMLEIFAWNVVTDRIMRTYERLEERRAGGKRKAPSRPQRADRSPNSYRKEEQAPAPPSR